MDLDEGEALGLAFIIAHERHLCHSILREEVNEILLLVRVRQIPHKYAELGRSGVPRPVLVCNDAFEVGHALRGHGLQHVHRVRLQSSVHRLEPILLAYLTANS